MRAAGKQQEIVAGDSRLLENFDKASMKPSFAFIEFPHHDPVKWSTVIRKVPLNAIDALSIGYAQPFTTFLSGLIEVTEEHVENKEDPNVPEKATINCMDYYYNLTDKKLDALKEQGAKTQQDIEIMKGNIEEIKKNVAEIKEIIERDVLPAIQDLQDVVTVKFKDMSKKLHDAVNEVKVYQTAKSWYEAFIKPIQHLRLDMGSLLQSFLDKNLVRAALRSMNETCWKHTPLNIATDVKSLTGAGCTSDVTMALLQDRNSEPESQAFADL
ncbi:hypothetical protein DdX_15637 [Ditylenchus destructor]|uniref:Uncharacterized protein n=1 Tax=Ditylenchus destructor TaxID=166010 RepID=A0AAD4QXJ6_9BILA|nr:hypothetical protein DdX_15637 [Ditylenchus destructor]